MRNPSDFFLLFGCLGLFRLNIEYPIHENSKCSLSWHSLVFFKRKTKTFLVYFFFPDTFASIFLAIISLGVFPFAPISWTHGQVVSTMVGRQRRALQLELVDQQGGRRWICRGAFSPLRPSFFFPWSLDTLSTRLLLGPLVS